MGPAAGLIFSLATGLKPLRQIPTTIFVPEPPPAHLHVTALSVDPNQAAKENWLFAILGFLAVCAIIWLLEELRAYKRHMPET